MSDELKKDLKESINSLIEALDESSINRHLEDIVLELSSLTRAVDRVADELGKRK